MREFLNGILNFIEQVSLTDEEFETVLATTQTYDQASYEDLARILQSRESISNAQDRLLGYYKAKGAEVTQADTAVSNIFLGATL